MKSFVVATFLSAPLVFAWFWHDRQGDSREAPASADATITRMPIEIIVSEAQPEWVFVPIDPR